MKSSYDKKTNLFVHFLEESTTRQSAYGFIWPLSINFGYTKFRWFLPKVTRFQSGMQRWQKWQDNFSMSKLEFMYFWQWFSKNIWLWEQILCWHVLIPSIFDPLYFLKFGLIFVTYTFLHLNFFQNFFSATKVMLVSIKHVRKRKLRQFKSKQQRVAHFALFQKKLELQAKTQIDPKRPLNNLQFTKW